MAVLFIIISPFIVAFLAGVVKGFTAKPPDETSETDELHEIRKQERVEILDNAIVQYNKLLDNLAAQLKEETNDKKRAAILKQQIIALEKLNRALEKREKLE